MRRDGLLDSCIRLYVALPGPSDCEGCHDIPYPVYCADAKRRRQAAALDRISPDDLKDFPAPVRQIMGTALYLAQTGGKHLSAKPLKGIVKGAGVLEVVDDHDANTYRTVYTVRLAGAVYVLHAFQKKAKKGIKTPAQRD